MGLWLESTRVRKPFWRERAGKLISVAAVALTAIFAGADYGHGQAMETAAAPGHELIVGVKQAPPFAMKDSGGNWSGVSIELWRQVAAELKLKYRFSEQPTVQKLLEETAAGKYDVAVAAITVTAERERMLDFTQSYYVTGLGIAVPAVGTMSWMPIVRAMTSFGFFQAVLGLVGLALVAGLLVWLFERRQNEHFGGGFRRGLISGVWWSTLAMTQRSGAAGGPRTIPGRAVAIVWMVSSIIAIAVFTAGITSVLTTKQLQGTVHGIGDLPSVRVGTVTGTAAVDALVKLRIRHLRYEKAEDGLKALRSGKIDTFVYDKPLLAWIIRKKYSSSVQLLDTTFDPQNYAFGLPAGSPLRKAVTIAILNTLHTDKWQDTLFRYIGSN